MSARDYLPIHQVRPADRHRKSGPPPGPARQAVEALLRGTPRDFPLTAEQVAARTGLEVDVARTHIGNICTAGLAHNVRPGARRAQYAGGRSPLAVRATAPAWLNDETHYDGRELRPYAGRPGAMDAFHLPSLRNGERVPRKPPAIMGASPSLLKAR